jgi:hypothetical protein
MFSGPFLPLAIVMFVSVVTVILMPMGVLFGYPWLLITSAFLSVKWSRGRLSDPGQTAAVWLCWLGIVVCVHGIVMSADVAIAGAPPSREESEFGNRVAMVGGCVAVVGASLACVLSLNKRKNERYRQKTTQPRDR